LLVFAGETRYPVHALIADELHRSLLLMRGCGNYWTSHEALLPYEAALTRRDPTTGHWYNCSAHMLRVCKRIHLDLRYTTACAPRLTPVSPGIWLFWLLSVVGVAEKSDGGQSFGSELCRYGLG
jgi:3-deoxy-D-arabino-heptulosonate 7-phosphate (DAHP) synthase class II